MPTTRNAVPPVYLSTPSTYNTTPHPFAYDPRTTAASLRPPFVDPVDVLRGQLAAAVRLLRPRPPLTARHNPPTPSDMTHATQLLETLQTDLDTAQTAGVGSGTSDHRATSHTNALQTARTRLAQAQRTLAALAQKARTTYTYHPATLRRVLEQLQGVYGALDGVPPRRRRRPGVPASGPAATSATAATSLAPPPAEWSTGQILERLYAIAVWCDVHEEGVTESVSSGPTRGERVATLVAFGVEFEQMRAHIIEFISTDARATAPAVFRLEALATRFTPRERAATLTPTDIRLAAQEARDIRQQLLTLRSSGMLLDDDAIRAADARANADLVAQWKTATPDVLDMPLREMAERFQTTWTAVFVELGGVGACFTDTTHPDYTAEWWVKVFVVMREVGGVVAAPGERLVFVGVGVLLLGLVLWLMGVGG